MIQLPPFDQPEQYPVWDLRFSVGGPEYRFVYTYRPRQDRWYLDVFNSAGVALMRGRKMVPGVVFLGRCMCVDTAGADDYPGYEDLGRRHVVVYLEDADLPAPVDDYAITIEIPT